MAAKSPILRPFGWLKAFRWGIGIFALVGLATWFLNKPDPEATQRQQICQSWGITDAEVLAKCRHSREDESAATEPFRRSAVEREIAEFNQDLSALSLWKTHANDTDYPSRSIEEVYEVAGGLLGFIIGPIDSATFPAKGRPAILFGLVVTNEPDPDDSPDGRKSEPRYFTLETEMRPPSAAATHEAANELSRRARRSTQMCRNCPRLQINLDIESLNRHERQFIIDHCHFVSATPCRATVLGHLDEIVGRRDALSRWRTYTGIVADQVDIEPLNWATARPNGLLFSPRSLMEEPR